MSSDSKCKGTVRLTVHHSPSPWALRFHCDRKLFRSFLLRCDSLAPGNKRCPDLSTFPCNRGLIQKILSLQHLLEVKFNLVRDELQVSNLACPSHIQVKTRPKLTSLREDMLGQHLYSCRDTSNNKFMNQSHYYTFYMKLTK